MIIVRVYNIYTRVPDSHCWHCTHVFRISHTSI